MNQLFWHEEETTAANTLRDDVIDLAFEINCRSLPVDHAWDLSTALAAILPWWTSEPFVGLHLIHGGDSGNGWQCPEGNNELIYLTRRTRLILRLPRTRIAETRATLSGQNLNISGYPLVIGTATERPLYPHPALYARQVIDNNSEENEFLAWTATELQKIALRFNKLLPGKKKVLITPDGEYQTRSLLVADLSLNDSLELQRRGLGPGRTLGCGIFTPHKTLAA